MAVNTAALKTFAPAMRRQLLEAVGRKLDLLFNSQTPDTLSTYARQIAELRDQEAENREQLLERVAYTWFNRLCALRYLDAKGWHPFGCKVLMPAGEGETQPELLKLMRAGSLPGELKPHTNEARLHGLLDGQIPPAMAGSDPQGEVYRALVLAACRSYHHLLPELFEGLDDASELLLPDDLLSEGSIAGAFRSSISDEDCGDVEIIGWLYQFYISEKKDQVIGKVVKSEDIPAATQLFTPNWIVKYMVQNTLGATWLATYPDSPLKGQMEFYIEPAEQTAEVQAQLAAITPESLDPEALTLIDPACGSGHILVEAYDLLKAIYLERGYRQRDIPQLILTRNLLGLDICPRAAQLAAFSLVMKAREDDRRLLERGIRLNCLALEDTAGLDVKRLAAGVDLAAAGLTRDDLAGLADLFEHATTFGSLIQVPPGLAAQLPALASLAERQSDDLFVAEDLKRLRVLVRQAEILARQYDAVVANPPYMGSKGMNPLAKEFAKKQFPDAKSDLFACFIERGYSFAKPAGYEAMVTMQSWMFLSSFEAMRQRLLEEKTITTMAHLGPRAFGSISGEVVQATAVVLRNTTPDGYMPAFFRLIEGGEAEKSRGLAAGEQRYDATAQDEFKKIPGSPVAYWVYKSTFEIFTNASRLDDLVQPRKGMVTARNAIYVREWYEVHRHRIGFGHIDRTSAEASGCKWFPYIKGGQFRRWYGNRSEVVDWERDGFRLRTTRHPTEDRVWATNFNLEYCFRPNVNWSDVTSGRFSARHSDYGSLFDATGLSCFPDIKWHFRVLAFLNSTIVDRFLKLLNPTLHFQAGNIADLPFPPVGIEQFQDCNVANLVTLAKTDWDAYERSWDFQRLLLLNAAPDAAPRTLEASYLAWTAGNRETIAEMKRLEEENNRLFIDAYGLADELTPDVPIDQITLTVNPAYRYGKSLTDAEWSVEHGFGEELEARFRTDSMEELISYAIGCMMGRYSLDQPGLILADSRDSQAAQLAAYQEKVGRSLGEVQFKPDLDGIIPVLDGEWFEDDIVARSREFLAVTLPESSVAENLRFIEESLGKDIRKYFCSEFYKDHLQTYKKRPIYWMVQSPAGPSRGGFACLIYLHRYTKDTLNQVLNNYFRPYLQKLEARLAQLEQDQINDDLKPRERNAARKEAEKITKVLKECQAWEQDALLPLAQQRIELDLDDGVKVNYLKLQDVLAKIPGLAAKED